MIKIIIIALVFFFTLFPVNFVFLPSMFSTRFILSLFGMVVWFVSLLSRRKLYYNKIITVFFLTVLTSIWSIICTSIFSSSNDYIFVKLPITISVMYFSCYLCISAIKFFYKKVDFDLVTRYFLWAIALQSMIVLAQFFDPAVGSFLTNIQRLSDMQVDIASSHLEDSSRFIGFGLLFYTASFFYGAALVLLAFQLRYKSLKKSSIAIYILLYFLTFFMGMGLSRSTIIGFLSSILIFIFPINNISGFFKIVLNSILSIIFSFIAIFVILKLFPNLSKDLEPLINNAFDFIIAYFNTGQVSSKSASETFEALVFPESLRTYFIGTGLYDTYFSVGDFNYSDIGYLRLLYYFGLPGLILYFMVEIKILSIAFKSKRLLPIYYSMLVILLITSIKGLTTLAVITMLYALISNKKNIVK